MPESFGFIEAERICLMHLLFPGISLSNIPTIVLLVVNNLERVASHFEED